MISLYFVGVFSKEYLVHFYFKDHLMRNQSEREVERPKWLKVTLASLSAWLTFLFSFFLYAFLILSVVDMVLKTDGLSGVIGVAVLAALVGLSIVSALFAAKWQHGLLARRRLRTNYIVLATLIILTLLCLPALFTYTIM